MRKRIIADSCIPLFIFFFSLLSLPNREQRGKNPENYFLYVVLLLSTDFGTELYHDPMMM